MIQAKTHDDSGGIAVEARLCSSARTTITWTCTSLAGPLTSCTGRNADAKAPVRDELRIHQVKLSSESTVSPLPEKHPRNARRSGLLETVSENVRILRAKIGAVSWGKKDNLRLKN